jgi:ubiquinone/menaquinone biosynthesis C-methylase UbiE
LDWSSEQICPEVIARMNIQDAYAEWSHTYDDDRNLTRDLDEEVMRRNFAGTRYQAALEIGCGTGKNTALLTEIADSVQAIDFSEAMIDRARRRLHSASVEFMVADLTKPWPVPDSSINLISCNLVLEHIENLSFIFAEAARVLADRGSFFISELHPFRQYLGTKASFQRNGQAHIIDAFVHDITDFIEAARNNNLGLKTIKEWRHEEDGDKPPRLISFLFEKP